MSRFASFREFYPFYLSEHRHPVSRRLHFIGSCGSCCWSPLPAARPAAVPAWRPVLRLRVRLGRPFFFEKNRPATFRHPLYSFMGDWVMFLDILRGRVRL